VIDVSWPATEVQGNARPRYPRSPILTLLEWNEACRALGVLSRPGGDVGDRALSDVGKLSGECGFGLPDGAGEDHGAHEARAHCAGRRRREGSHPAPGASRCSADRYRRAIGIAGWASDGVDARSLRKRSSSPSVSVKAR
jgi:hypothetical protein